MELYATEYAISASIRCFTDPISKTAVSPSALYAIARVRARNRRSRKTAHTEVPSARLDYVAVFNKHLVIEVKLVAEVNRHRSAMRARRRQSVQTGFVAFDGVACIPETLLAHEFASSTR